MQRLSLGRLMLFVALAAAGLAALRISPSPIRTSALFSLTFLLLLVAAAGAMLRRTPSWVGFCLFGWGWFVASFTALVIAPLNSTADRQPVPLLIPSLLLVEWHLRAFAATPIDAPVAVIPNTQGGHALAPYRLVQDYTSVAPLLMGCVGSLVAWVMRAPRSGAD